MEPYYIKFDGKYLTSDNGLVLLHEENGDANQLWKLSKTEGNWTISNTSDGRCLDDKWLETTEGSTVWLYESNRHTCPSMEIITERTSNTRIRFAIYPDAKDAEYPSYD